MESGILDNPEIEEKTDNFYFNSVNEFELHYRNVLIEGLNILQINARSILNYERFDQLKLIVQSLPCDLHAIIISETWINNYSICDSYVIPGFTGSFSCRTDRSGGGLAIFIRDDINFEIIKIADKENFVITLSLKNILPQQKDLLLTAVYRPPSTNVNEFLNNLNNDICESANQSQIIIGDINIDTLKNSHDSDAYQTMVVSSGFSICNTHPTRESSSSLIDHVVSNITERLQHNVITIYSDFSDHNLIITNLATTAPSKINKSYSKTIIDYNLAKQQLSRLFETRVSTNDPNVYLRYMTESLTNTISKHSKTKVISQKCKNTSLCPWMNSVLTRMLRTKSNLSHKLKLTMRNSSIPQQVKDNLSKEYHEYSNKFNNAKKVVKSNYYEERFSSGDQKNTWRELKKLLGTPSKSKTIETIVSANSIPLHNDDKKADELNQYFTTIGQNLSQQIPELNGDDINKFNSIFHNNNSIFLYPTNTNEVYRLIQSLKPNKSPGYDNIDVNCIKNFADELSPFIVELINLVLTTGIYPDKLKIAKVIPIFKSGDRKLPSNYRPISILSIFNKILEKVLFKRVYDFLECNNFFYKYQYGFRPKSNTTLAVIELVNSIQTAVDNKHFASGIFLDLSKAFDCVSHEILLHKLNKAGIRGVSNELFKNYLTDREQFVVVNNVKSSTRKIRIGVPQGSVLGPLLYLIYINDIGLLPLTGKLELFADDTSAFYSSQDACNINVQMQQDLNVIAEYYRLNKLSLNLAKTKVVNFGHFNRLNLAHDVIYNNVPIENVDSIKYLGITIDSKLNWKEHINNIQKSVSPVLGLIRKFSFFLPISALKKIYFSLVHSRFQYLISIWGSAVKTNLKKIQTLQNRAWKYIFKLPQRHASVDLYVSKIKSVLPIKGLYALETSYLVHSILNDSLHHNSIFNQNIYRYNIRRPNQLRGPHRRTNVGRSSFSYCGPLIFNLTPDYLRSIPSSSIFRSSLKKHYLLENNITAFLNEL